MVAEQVCNYLMGGLIMLTWIYKLGLAIFMLYLIYYGWKYWCRCKYGPPIKIIKNNRRK